jgi:hypothetical protein
MRLLGSTLLLARTRTNGGRHHGRALLSVRIRAYAQLAQLNETAATAVGVISVVVGVIGVVVGGCGCDRGALARQVEGPRQGASNLGAPLQGIVSAARSL